MKKLKNIKNLRLKAIGILVVGLLVSLVVYCSTNTMKSSAEECNKKESIVLCDTLAKRDTNIEINNGNYSVCRNMLSNETTMGDKEKWTFFIYMCGSDYESKNGAASEDIKEMLAANISDNVRIIIQTGGARQWKNSNIDKNKIQRFEIQDNKLNLLYEKSIYDNNGKVRSLGNPDELYEFLSWGMKNYASEKMGVILWNHGGGSSDGICYDENAQMDALELGELELAFSQTRKEMTSRFEFVGFDACVMQNIETANLMVPYAKYMVGSETAELKKGLNYTEFLEMISTCPKTSTIDLCKKICDSSYEAYTKNLTGIISTGSVDFSVIDLQKVDDFLYSFNEVAKELNDTIGTDKYYTVLNKIQNSQRFGAGQIDIYNFLSNIANDISSAKNAMDKLDNVISYNKKANVLSWYKNATGLSMFISSEYAQLQNYNNLRNVCISPYLMNYYESIVYGTNYGNLDRYFKDKIMWQESEDYYDETFQFVNNIFKDEKDYRKNYSSNAFFSKVSFDDIWFSVLKYKTGVSILDEASNIQCDKDLFLDENGKASLVLNNSSIDKVCDVKYTIFSEVYDENEGCNVYIELGQSNQVSLDKVTGKVTENFDGRWLMLPNGLPLATTDVQNEENYVRQISPCFINNDYVYLYTTLNKETNEVVIEGYADDYDNKSIQTKVLSQLEIGDCIQPMFMYTKNLENGAIFKDSEMNFGFCDVNDDFKLEYTNLENQKLYTSIVLKDVFGTSIYTPIEKYNR